MKRWPIECVRMKDHRTHLFFQMSSVCIVVAIIVGCQNPMQDVAVTPAKSHDLESNSRSLTLEGGIVVNVQDGEVVLPGHIALDRGWLEVVACIEGTREHEAIFVTAVQPAFVHAALLLIGAEPGAPAQYDPETKTSTSASGTRVDVFVEWDDSSGRSIRRPVSDLVEIEGQSSLPEFVFAGSLTRPNPPSKGPGEYYVADYGGTVVGLATFGDEVVATKKVHSPDLGIQPAAWQIALKQLPSPGTPARLVLCVKANLK